jgi:signal transduction histidine kinase
VRSDGAHVGFIRLADKYDGDFTDSDEAILVQLAQMVTAAVEKSQADTLVHANAERTRRLLAVAAALSEAVTPAHVAGAVTTAVVAAVGAQAASVSVRSPSGQDVEVLSASGYPESLLDAWRRFPIDASVPVARAIRTGAPLWLGATHGGDDHPGLDALREATRLPSHAVLPLTAEGRAVGALVLSFAEPQAFALEDRAVLTAVARQCAQALERARLYDAERRARQAAEAANRAKFEFLATMSHELRTPLNAIGGYVDLIEMGLRGPVTGDQHHDLERVKRAQQHLLGLINDVLNFAKLDAGRVSYAITDVPVGDAVASVEAMITPQLRAKGLAYAAGTCAPATTVRADPEKLRQILLNLLTNALKFTDAGGRISVSCQADDTAVRLRVADTGMGIPADKVATIFDPFVQVDRGLSRPSEGIGLGLAISRDLARGMGGELTVDTRYGAGSTFTLTLPRG